MSLLTGYAEELQQYQLLIPGLRDAVYSVVFWRGHFPVHLRVLQCPPLPSGEERRFWDRCTKQTTIYLPLHSMVAFIGGILLAADFSLLPSFILFGFAWFLLSTSGHFSRFPSPWENHHRTFLELCGTMLLARPAVETIEPHQNEEAVTKFHAEKEEEYKKQKEKLEKKTAEENPQDFAGELEALNEEEIDITHSGHGFNVTVNPLKPILFPLQKHLEQACVAVRIARSLVTWEEPIYAFWIVLACMGGGLVLAFVPWGFILHWCFTISVWVFLGPWMKLADIFLMKKKSTEEEREEVRARMREKYKELLASATHRQTKKEDLTKLKQMKRYMFGKFLAAVPRFKQARHIDTPLSSSHASPHVADTDDSIDIVCRKYGQHLTGDMIPTR